MSEQTDIESIEFSSRDGLAWHVELIIASHPDLRIRIDSTTHSADGHVGSKALFRAAIDQAVLALQAIQKQP